MVYRGCCRPSESGRPGNPIRLTSNPLPGERATQASTVPGASQALFGRARNAQSALGIPSPEVVWYKDNGTEFTPHSVWMVAGGAITRISLARDPNWKVSNPDDVKSEWYEWEKTEPVDGDHREGNRCAPALWASIQPT